MTGGYATDTEEVEDGMKTPTGDPAADAAHESTPPATTGAEGVMTEPAVLEPESPEDISDVSDHDSALGQEDNASSTVSMTSSVANYRIENGRTYHAFKEHIGYPLPNDAAEQARLDLQHHLFSLTFDGRLYFSPIDSGRPVRRCLDAGTGTGAWAVDFADDHPAADVIGIDISPIQPAFVPPNLSFQVDDLEDDWTFSQPFDFIFSRMMSGALDDWPRFFQQSFDNLSPGGWLEVHDMCLPVRSDDGTLKEDSYLVQWSDKIFEATEIQGRPCNGARLYRQQMIDTGFTNVREIRYKWPMNRWPADPHYKDLGFWTHQNIAGGISGLSMALFTRVLRWNLQELEVFLAKVRDDMKNRTIHAYWTIHVVYGQRPAW